MTRRERLDYYYAAGASYGSIEIEKALRVRCGRIHEDEKRTNSRSDGASKPSNAPSFKKKVIVKRKINNTHVAECPEAEEDFLGDV